MKKTKIYGIGNEGKFNYLVTSKNSDFLLWLSKILPGELSNEMETYDNITYKNKKGKIIVKEIKRNPEKYKDLHLSYPANDSRLDVFYGKKKAFIVINTSLRNRKNIMDAIERYSIWYKPKK